MPPAIGKEFQKLANCHFLRGSGFFYSFIGFPWAGKNPSSLPLLFGFIHIREYFNEERL